ncbi:histidinol-phosphate aminotransferase family protein [Mucilaginibacter mali]|uniref:Histidinol-phosphate aminotransferase family protein n=1 Tax=Mucilaginibacter mali TaxID=2740462 RepID=A0A7D4UF75_9SPHI|nr:histidinol-phosphate transaminase [Mucilaginibacter mali]QKJ29996.1 histidinol-phosphate aminotransferase family protein [Mucilaginibacter mali]
MATSLNRRNWIKTSALMAGGLAVASGTLEKLSAMPLKQSLASPLNSCLTDREAILQAPPVMKARLSANENPFGPSAAAKKAIQEAIDTSYQYPFANTRTLMMKIAEHEGVTPQNILMDAGSTPILAAAGTFYGMGGKEIISGEVSYDDLPSHAERLGSKWVKVPMTSDYKLDLDAMEAKVNANTGLVYICNPNNPTATVVDTQKLKDFCERVSKKTMVFVDEAYIDYMPDPKSATMIDMVKKGSNIIVARTFSKLYGFAGLRCGYIIAQPQTARTLSGYATGVMSLNALTIAAAIAAYQETDFLQDALKKTLASKEYLYSVLKKEGYDYIPSSANFVLFPVKMEAQRFVQELNNRGVSVRPWKMNGKDYCRVSIGRMDEMEAFAEAFKQIS